MRPRRPGRVTLLSDLARWRIESWINWVISGYREGWKKCTPARILTPRSAVSTQLILTADCGLFHSRLKRAGILKTPFQIAWIMRTSKAWGFNILPKITCLLSFQVLGLNSMNIKFCIFTANKELFVGGGGGLHSTAQQPRVWFLAFPRIFLLMLVRFIDSTA